MEVCIRVTEQGGTVQLRCAVALGTTPPVKPIWRPWHRSARCWVQRLDHFLLTGCALLESWPNSEGPAIALPALDHPATRRLNRQAQQWRPLPEGYHPPGAAAVTLGWSPLDGRTVGIPLWADRTHAPLLITGGTELRRPLLARLVADVLAAEGTVVYLDPSGDQGVRLVTALPEITPHWIDLDSPGASTRLNLLAGATGTAAADGALGELLEEYLRARHAIPLTTEGLAGRVHTELSAQLADYARRRHLGTDAVPPTLWSLYTALAADHGGSQLGAPGADGPARQMAAMTLQGRLAPLVEHPTLAPFWRDAADAPSVLLHGGLWLGRLPALRVAAGEAEAAWAYGHYLWTCIRALAATSPPRRPFWVIVEDVPAWKQAGVEIRDAVGDLTAAGITVVWTARSFDVDWDFFARARLWCGLELSPREAEVASMIPPRLDLHAIILAPGSALVRLPEGVATITLTAPEPVPTAA